MALQDENRNQRGSRCRDQGGEDLAHKSPQPGEEEAQVITDGTEDRVGGIAVTSFEIVAVEVAGGLDVANHRLDGGAAPELTLNRADHASLLSGDEDASRPWRAWPRR